MCITTVTVYEICRHTVTSTDPCFSVRHPNIPFTRCRPSTVLDLPPSLCPSCLAIFAEGDIDGYSATRLVSQWRRRENYAGVLIPRLGTREIRMMDRHGSVFGRSIPRGTWWSEIAEGTELESARGRSRRLQQQPREPESLMQSVRPGPPGSPRSPQSPRQTGTGGYRRLNRNSSLF